MDKRSRWSRVLVVAGLVAMLVGLIDPLEGSIVILAGAIVLTVGALLIATRFKKLIVWSLALIAFGVGALWYISSFGGLGAGTGRTNWWWLAIAPYPVGFVLGIVGGILRLREGRKAAAAPPAQ